MNNPRPQAINKKKNSKSSGIFEKQEPKLGILKSIFVLRSPHDD